MIICRIPLSEQGLAIVGLGSGEAQQHPRLTRAGRAPLSCSAPPWGSQEPAESPSLPGRPKLLVRLPLPQNRTSSVPGLVRGQQPMATLQLLTCQAPALWRGPRVGPRSVCPLGLLG